jgi:excisionase family DNA binding protein
LRSEAPSKCGVRSAIDLESIDRSAIGLEKGFEKMKYFTLQEAAAQLRISRRTIHYLLERGELKRIKISGKRFITEDELSRFVTAAVEAAA